MDVTGVSSNSRWQLEGARIGRGGGAIASVLERLEIFSLFSSFPPPKHHLLCSNKLKFYSEFTRFTDEDIKTQTEGVSVSELLIPDGSEIQTSGFLFLKLLSLHQCQD